MNDSFEDPPSSYMHGMPSSHLNSHLFIIHSISITHSIQFHPIFISLVCEFIYYFVPCEIRFSDFPIVVCFPRGFGDNNIKTFISIGKFIRSKLTSLVGFNLTKLCDEFAVSIYINTCLLLRFS